MLQRRVGRERPVYPHTMGGETSIPEAKGVRATPQNGWINTVRAELQSRVIPSVLVDTILSYVPGRNFIYVLGGWRVLPSLGARDEPRIPTAEVWRYDIDANRWEIGCDDATIGLRVPGDHGNRGVLTASDSPWMVCPQEVASIVVDNRYWILTPNDGENTPLFTTNNESKSAATGGAAADPANSPLVLAGTQTIIYDFRSNELVDPKIGCGWRIDRSAMNYRGERFFIGQTFPLSPPSAQAQAQVGPFHGVPSLLLVRTHRLFSIPYQTDPVSGSFRFKSNDLYPIPLIEPAPTYDDRLVDAEHAFDAASGCVWFATPSIYVLVPRPFEAGTGTTNAPAPYATGQHDRGAIRTSEFESGTMGFYRVMNHPRLPAPAIDTGNSTNRNRPLLSLAGTTMTVYRSQLMFIGGFADPNGNDRSLTANSVYAARIRPRNELEPFLPTSAQPKAPTPFMLSEFERFPPLNHARANSAVVVFRPSDMSHLRTDTHSAGASGGASGGVNRYVPSPPPPADDDSQLFVLGGYQPARAAPNTIPESSVERYVESEKRWEVVAPLPAARAKFLTAAIANI